MVEPSALQCGPALQLGFTFVAARRHRRCHSALFRRFEALQELPGIPSALFLRYIVLCMLILFV